jgi:hydrogenase maturation factor
LNVGFPAGKLPAAELRRFLAAFELRDPSVIVGGAVGEDAAVLDLGGQELLVAKTDPITFATEDAGRYLVAVNSNDLATTGAEPRWLLVTALLPEGASEELVARVFTSLRAACEEAGIALVGGHTEMTVNLDRPLLVGCLLGTVPRRRLLRTAGARPGDAVLLAGGVAIEGTAILAREHAALLRARGVEDEIIERAADWLQKPGISVLPAARLLRSLDGIHAMHDPTEGGVATALEELAEAACCGLRVDLGAIPVLEESRRIAQALGLDPLGLLASGALLASLAPESVEEALVRLAAAGIPAAVIGRVVPPGEGSPLPRFARDELARFLSSLAGAVAGGPQQTIE